MELDFETGPYIFTRLKNGEDVICPMCGCGHVKSMIDIPLEDASSFECDNCRAHFRYDPVVVTVE